MKKKLFLCTWVAFLTTLVSCSNSGSAKHEQSVQKSDAVTAQKTTDVSSDQWGKVIKIKDTTGQKIVTFKLANGRDKIEFGESIIYGEQKGDKWKYHSNTSSGSILEIKFLNDGFKLKSPDGTLKWKVKYKDDKIKISDNEEGNNPIELKFKDDKIKLVYGGAELGKARFYSDKNMTKVKDSSEITRFKIKDAPLSSAFPLLLATSIPETERYVLMAELLIERK